MEGFFCSLLGKYKGPDRTVMWMVFESAENPVQWIEISNHPNPSRSILFYVFTNLNIIEIHRDTKGLKISEPNPTAEVIFIEKSPNWQSQMTEAIEEWIAT